jgi:hypothetical protein
MLVVEEECKPDHLIEMINIESTGKVDDICSRLNVIRGSKIKRVAIRDFKNRLCLACVSESSNKDCID